MQDELREVAYHYLVAARTTPLGLQDGPKGMKLSARVQYLERNVIKPAEQLLKALSESAAPMLSEWPETLDRPAPDKVALTSELTKLRDRVRELRLLLDDRISNTNLSTEYRTDLGWALTAVLQRHFPDLEISRGTYDKAGDPEGGTMHGRFLETMAICVHEILPDERRLSSKIVGQLRKMDNG